MLIGAVVLLGDGVLNKPRMSSIALLCDLPEGGEDWESEPGDKPKIDAKSPGEPFCPFVVVGGASSRSII